MMIVDHFLVIKLIVIFGWIRVYPPLCEDACIGLWLRYRLAACVRVRVLKMLNEDV